MFCKKHCYVCIFNRLDPYGIDHFRGDKARDLLLGATPPMAQAAHILADRTTKSWRLGGDFRGLSIFGVSDFPTAVPTKAKRSIIPSEARDVVGGLAI